MGLFLSLKRERKNAVGLLQVGTCIDLLSEKTSNIVSSHGLSFIRNYYLHLTLQKIKFNCMAETQFTIEKKENKAE